MNRRGFIGLALAGALTASAIPFNSAAQVGPGGYYDYVPDPYANVDVVPQNIYRHATLASDSSEDVGVQLVLAMDTSGSMNDEEFEIELMATAYALNSELVRSAIKYRSGENSVAISVIDFDSFSRLRVPWVDIRGDEINDKPYRPEDPAGSSAAPDKLDMLVQEIINLPRRGSGGTSIETAMDLTYNLYLGCPWQPDDENGKRVLDVFGDGQSSQTLMQVSREKLQRLGTTINGFAIVNEDPSLDQFFRNYLVTRSRVISPDGVVSDYGRVWAIARNMPSRDDKVGLQAYFDDVATGMAQKISIEVSGVDGYLQTLERLGLEPAQPIPNQIGLDRVPTPQIKPPLPQ